MRFETVDLLRAGREHAQLRALASAPAVRAA